MLVLGAPVHLSAGPVFSVDCPGTREAASIDTSVWQVASGRKAWGLQREEWWQYRESKGVQSQRNRRPHIRKKAAGHVQSYGVAMGSLSRS